MRPRTLGETTVELPQSLIEASTARRLANHASARSDADLPRRTSEAMIRAIVAGEEGWSGGGGWVKESAGQAG